MSDELFVGCVLQGFERGARANLLERLFAFWTMGVAFCQNPIYFLQMASHFDANIYLQWLELLGWMGDYAQKNGLECVKVSDFPDYIYRMERPFELPTTTASVSLNRGENALLLAAVSPRHVALKSVSVRLVGGSKHWHLHAGESGLLEGKRPFTRERFEALAAQALLGS